MDQEGYGYLQGVMMVGSHVTAQWRTLDSCGATLGRCVAIHGRKEDYTQANLVSNSNSMPAFFVVLNLYRSHEV